MPRVTIETTQNVALNYEVASVGERMLGALVDNLIKWAYLIFVFVILGKMEFNYKVDYVVFIFAFLPFAFYSLISEIFYEWEDGRKKWLRKLK